MKKNYTVSEGLIHWYYEKISVSLSRSDYYIYIERQQSLVTQKEKKKKAIKERVTLNVIR